MKASKFTEAQIVFVLKQAQDGTPTAEVCRKAGISDVTFYNWRKKYAGLMLSEMRRLRQLEDENTKLKQIVSDLSLDKAMLQDVLSKKAPRPTRKCELVDRLRSEWKVSIRQVYSTLRIDLALYVYKEAFHYFRMGTATAVGTMMIAVAAILTVVFTRLATRSRF